MYIAVIIADDRGMKRLGLTREDFREFKLLFIWLKLVHKEEGSLTMSLSCHFQT